MSSMGRGFAVLDALATHAQQRRAPATVTEVALAAGRERSQTSRVLTALAANGLAERDSLGYQLSPLVYASTQALTARRLLTEGLTALEQVSATTGEACFLGELYGDSTVTIAEALPRGQRLIASWVGRAYPAFCSDAGQAVLWDAEDDEVSAVLARTDFSSGGPRAARDITEFIARIREARSRGYSIVDEEAEPGLLSVAAPVHDFRGEVIAAMQIVGPRVRLEARVEVLGHACRTAADELSRALGAPSDVRDKPPAPAPAPTTA